MQNDTPIKNIYKYIYKQILSKSLKKETNPKTKQKNIQENRNRNFLNVTQRNDRHSKTTLTSPLQHHIAKSQFPANQHRIVIAKPRL